MNVAAILRQKGRAVTTTSPSTTLLEVARKARCEAHRRHRHRGRKGGRRDHF